jgi:predicted kinase
MRAVPRSMSMGHEPVDTPPPLIIVSGAPGSGKSTLATLLAKELHLPLLCKDELKEVHFDTLGAPDPETARKLGPPAYEILWAVLRRLLDAGGGGVIESNFYRGWSEEKLRPFVARTRAVLVHCHASRENIRRRYVERSQRGERHPAHFDGAQVERLLANIDNGAYEPLDLDVRAIVVDTSDGYVPALDVLLALIRRETKAGPP